MTNIFLAHTEYHILLALRIILHTYPDDENIVYYTNGRVKKPLCVSHLPQNIKFISLNGNNYGNKDTLLDMLSHKPNRAFFYQQYLPGELYLIYHLHKEKIIIGHVQDGLDPYILNKRRRLPLVIIKESVEIYMKMIQKRIVIPSFFFRDYKYGSLKWIDELWIEFPDNIPFKSAKKLCAIPNFDEKVFGVAKTLFQYTSNENTSNAIIYIGQPLRTTELRNNEVQIIQHLLRNHSSKLFIYRPHPLESAEQIKNISNLNGVVVCNGQFPIEMMLYSMKNSIIVSGWSAALLLSNNSCRFYWIYKLLLKGKELSYLQFEIYNPTQHIKIAETIDDIV